MAQQPKLSCELVPSNQWGTNLRSVLAPKQWDELRAACYQRAGHKCEVCGGVGRKHPVECHEIWEYQDGPEWRQTLTGLVALCPSCHKVKHIGFAFTQGDRAFMAALNHLAKVNDWSPTKTYDYVNTQFQIHAIRSQQKWVINLDWLDNKQQYIDETPAVARQAHANSALATIEAIARSREARQKRLSEASTERPKE